MTTPSLSNESFAAAHEAKQGKTPTISYRALAHGTGIPYGTILRWAHIGLVTKASPGHIVIDAILLNRLEAYAPRPSSKRKFKPAARNRFVEKWRPLVVSDVLPEAPEGTLSTKEVVEKYGGTQQAAGHAAAGGYLNAAKVVRAAYPGYAYAIYEDDVLRSYAVRNWGYVEPATEPAAVDRADDLARLTERINAAAEVCKKAKETAGQAHGRLNKLLRGEEWPFEHGIVTVVEGIQQEFHRHTDAHNKIVDEVERLSKSKAAEQSVSAINARLSEQGESIGRIKKEIAVLIRELGQMKNREEMFQMGFQHQINRINDLAAEVERVRGRFNTSGDGFDADVVLPEEPYDKPSRRSGFFNRFRRNHA